METKVKAMNVLKFAGAFVAFIIGSGFASGQEIMQFFTSFGYMGVIGAVISCVLFAWSGAALMARGYDKKETIDDETKHSFDYWMVYKEKGNNALYVIGKALSVFYEWFVPIFMYSVAVIMISGAGATMNEYFGVPVQVGCFIMAALVLVSLLFGLRRLIDIIGMLGPITILFTICIALLSLMKNLDGLAAAGEVLKATPMPQAAGSWWLAGILYVAFNVTGSVPFLTSMGAGATSRKEAVLGAVVGSVMLMGAGVLLVLSQLAYAGEVADLAVPNLYLGDMVSPIFGMIFSVILLGEIFSTAAPMLWVTCDKFTKEGTTAHKLLVVGLSALAFLGGQLPFGMLVGTVYPYVGYLGIFLFVCMAARQLLERNAKKQ